MTRLGSSVGRRGVLRKNEEEDSDLDSMFVAASVAYEQETGSSHQHSPTLPINTSSTLAPPPPQAIASLLLRAMQTCSECAREQYQCTLQRTQFCIWQEWTKHRVQMKSTKVQTLGAVA